MLKALNKLSYIALLILLSLLILDNFYVIKFSENPKHLIIFFTFILILLTSSKGFFSGKSGLLKFTNFIILFCTVVGGAIAVYGKQLNSFIYICILFSLIQGIIELVYIKA